MSTKGLIVWVEDEKRYVRDIIAELKDRDFEVETIGNANELFKQLKSVLDRAKLIILDLWLPVGSTECKNTEYPRVPSDLIGNGKNTKRGIWVCKEIRKAIKDAKLSVPLIVLSGNLDVDTLDELKSAGIPESCLFKKPADFDEFINRIVELASTNRK